MFRDALDKFMLENKLTQKDVADRIGVTQQTVSDWLSGKQFPKASRIPRISEVMGISVETILQYSVSRFCG